MVEGFRNGIGPGPAPVSGSVAGAGRGPAGPEGANPLAGDQPAVRLLPAQPATVAGAGGAATDPAIGGLVRDLAGRPPVDHARVAELKMRIAAGAYPIDPGRIADAMIASELPSAAPR